MRNLFIVCAPLLLMSRPGLAEGDYLDVVKCRDGANRSIEVAWMDSSDSLVYTIPRLVRNCGISANNEPYCADRYDSSFAIDDTRSNARKVITTSDVARSFVEPVQFKVFDGDFLNWSIDSDIRNHRIHAKNNVVPHHGPVGSLEFEINGTTGRLSLVNDQDFTLPEDQTYDESLHDCRWPADQIAGFGLKSEHLNLLTSLGPLNPTTYSFTVGPEAAGRITSAEFILRLGREEASLLAMRLISPKGTQIDLRTGDVMQDNMWSNPESLGVGEELRGENPVGKWQLLAWDTGNWPGRPNSSPYQITSIEVAIRTER
jgi:hypothetical protein